MTSIPRILHSTQEGTGEGIELHGREQSPCQARNGTVRSESEHPASSEVESSHGDNRGRHEQNDNAPDVSNERPEESPATPQSSSPNTQDTSQSPMPSGRSNSGDLLLQHMHSIGYVNPAPNSNLMTKMTAISGIVACIVGLLTLGVSVWQVVQNTQDTGGSSDSRKDSERKDKFLPPETGPSDKVQNVWKKMQTVSIVVVGVLAACLALAISIYAVLAVSRRRTPDRRPSDFIVSQTAMSAISQLKHHTKHHTKRASELIKSYHVSLQQVGAEQWRFWATPTQTEGMLKRRIEEDDEESDAILEPTTASSSDDENDYWQGEIKLGDTEDDSGEETSPEEFSLVDTHRSARSVIDLGESELHRRFKEREELLRKRDDTDK